MLPAGAPRSPLSKKSRSSRFWGYAPLRILAGAAYLCLSARICANLYDIRTQTQYAVVSSLAQSWEDFARWTRPTPRSGHFVCAGRGASSKKVAYGDKRADFSYICGGVVPSILVANPDFPENKEDWPFLWGENEYNEHVVDIAADYLYSVHAAIDLARPLAWNGI